MRSSPRWRRWWRRRRFVAGNFFSFFTVEANTLAVISLLLSSYAIAAGWSSRRLDLFRGAVALYMTTTILVFIVLLSGYSSAELTAVRWDNTVLHYIMPIVIILDWILAQRTAPIPFRRALLWLLFPLAYVVYSLVRGRIVRWYPYPFMDANQHGYLAVLVTSIVIAVVLTAIAWIVSTVPRWPHPTLTDPQSLSAPVVPVDGSRAGTAADRHGQIMLPNRRPIDEHTIYHYLDQDETRLFQRRPRPGEYEELLERLPTLRQERAKGRATYAEVEESEADLDRFRGHGWPRSARATISLPRPARQRAAASIRLPQTCSTSKTSHCTPKR